MEVARKYPKSKAEKKIEESTFDLLTTVHESEVCRVKPDIEPAYRFEVTLEPDIFTEEKFALYDNYQRHAHHEGEDDISRVMFKRFLCNSPLHRHEQHGRRYGSYHQCYRLDGRLIAMSVLDLLPHAVSGAYFLYHSDFEKWSLGKLSALREAALASEEGYKYYYMGYYIHSCRKMKYKAEYRPQYVLDYHSGEWDMLDAELKSLMDRRKYASKSLERDRLAKESQSMDGAVKQNGDVEAAKPAAVDEAAKTDPDGDSPIFPVPLEATSSGLSVLELGMPGTLTLRDLRQKVSLGEMKFFVGRGMTVHKMQNIAEWEQGTETNPRSIKGIIAEFAAVVGQDVAGEIVVDFRG